MYQASINSVEDNKDKPDTLEIVKFNNLIEKIRSVTFNPATYEEIKKLLKEGVNPNWEMPVPALYVAILVKNINICKLLISFGANINKVFSFGTYLDFAWQDDNYSIAKLLISHGASVEKVMKPIIKSMWLKMIERPNKSMIKKLIDITKDFDQGISNINNLNILNFPSDIDNDHYEVLTIRILTHLKNHVWSKGVVSTANKIKAFKYIFKVYPQLKLFENIFNELDDLNKISKELFLIYNHSTELSKLPKEVLTDEVLKKIYIDNFNSFIDIYEIQMLGEF